MQKRPTGVSRVTEEDSEAQVLRDFRKGEHSKEENDDTRCLRDSKTLKSEDIWRKLADFKNNNSYCLHATCQAQCWALHRRLFNSQQLHTVKTQTGKTFHPKSHPRKSESRV